jgi:putative glutamine amidotransferase
MNGTNILLPKLDGKDNTAIPRLYKNALDHSESFKNFRPFFEKAGSIGDQFPIGKISDLPEIRASLDFVPFVVFANHPGLMNPKSKPLQHFKKSFDTGGAALYIIPFGLNALLADKEELKSYFELISKHFPALVAAGGGDVDPSLYGEKNKYSIDPNLVRDQAELQLIQSFVSSGQGVFYGICRGHQAYAVAMGGTLIQDLPMQLSPNVIHRPTKNPDGTISSSWHSITLTGQNNSLFQAVAKDSLLVNSRHHQAVKSLPSDKGEVIALAGGNVIEALEKKDAQGQLRVLTFQFHPEDMETPDSDKIIKFMIDQARRVQPLKITEKQPP